MQLQPNAKAFAHGVDKDKSQADRSDDFSGNNTNSRTLLVPVSGTLFILQR